MTKKLIKFGFFVFVFFSAFGIVNADERIANENVISDASISLELAFFDASSSTGILNIMVDPGSQSANASGLVLNFATSTIQINSILTGNSFCSFFLENNFDNSTGKLSLSGMKPYPGIATSSLMGQIFFEKISTSSSDIIINQDESMVLANNGYATNVLATSSSLKL
ncbi:hypothetical protein C0584_03220 [Candidatus Parcubacteria bacterium]|mgnify:CR=1 FL=1|nr:MAG: hypothetical protein C0584_03220 [Candidatus Parcubacteria bacterium]